MDTRDGLPLSSALEVLTDVSVPPSFAEPVTIETAVAALLRTVEPLTGLKRRLLAAVAPELDDEIENWL